MSRSEIRTEKYELPSTVDGICSLLREILNGGSVKRIELDTDDTYVRVRRWIEGDGLEEDEVTWDGALRAVPNMVEYYSDEATSFQVLVDMTLLGQDEGLFCTSWVTGFGNEELLRKWLEVDERGLPVRSVDLLLGLPIYRAKSIPEETLVLCCSRHPSADPSEITLAVKTTMDFRRSHVSENSEDAGSGRDHSEERDSTAGVLSLNTRGLRRVAWNSSIEDGQ